MSAIIRVIPPPEVPAILAGPGFGKWEAVPLAHSFSVRKQGGGATVVNAGYGTLAEAQAAAAELNGLVEGRGPKVEGPEVSAPPSPFDLRPSLSPRCICDDAFPGPIDAIHCPACGSKWTHR